MNFTLQGPKHQELKKDQKKTATRFFRLTVLGGEQMKKLLGCLKVMQNHCQT